MVAPTTTTVYYAWSSTTTRLLIWWIAFTMSTAGLRCVASLAREHPCSLVVLFAQQRSSSTFLLSLYYSTSHQRQYQYETCAVNRWRYRNARLSQQQLRGRAGCGGHGVAQLSSSTNAPDSSSTTTKTTTTKLPQESTQHLPTSETQSSSPSIANWKTQWRRRTGRVFSAVGFVASSTRALYYNGPWWSQWQTKWNPTVQALRGFLERSGIDLEIAAQLNVRLLENLMILSRVERAMLNGADRRDLALLSTGINESDCDKDTASWRPPLTNQALRYVTYVNTCMCWLNLRWSECISS